MFHKHFEAFLKCFLSNVLKTFYQNMQSLKVRIEWAQFLSHSLTILDIKNNIYILSNLKKILNLTSDPTIIETLLYSFVMFSKICH